MAKRLGFAMVVFSLSLFFSGCGSNPGCKVNLTSSGGSGSNGVGAAPNDCNANGGTGGGGSGSGGNAAGLDFVYYIADNTSPATIVAAQLGAGNFIPITGITNPPETDLAVDDMLALGGKFLYVPEPTNNTVSGYSINSSSGELTAIQGSPFPVNSAATAESIATDPKGRFLFIGQEAGGAISVFTINGTSGALSEISGSPFLSFGLTSADSMTVDSSGKFLYVGQSNASSGIAAFSIDQSSGALSPVAGSPFNLGVAQIHADPAGNFLLGVAEIADNASSATDQHIYVFSIDPTTGAPTAVAGSPFATVSAPFDFVFHPTGNFVYVTGVNSSGTVTDVEGYQFAATTGALTAIAGSPFSGSVGAYCKMDPSGKILVCQNDSIAGFSGFGVDSTTGVLSGVLSLGASSNLPFAWAVTN